MTEVELLEILRQVCLHLPEVRETVKWGHPTFEAGKKMFAVLDQYEGQPCIAFRAAPEARETLLADERFFEAPYASGKGWICLRAEALINKKEVGELLRNSYRLVALKRMLSALDGPAPSSRSDETRTLKRPRAKGPAGRTQS